MSDPLDDIHTNNAADNSDYGRRPTMTTDDPPVWLRENIRTLPGEPGPITDALIDVAEATKRLESLRMTNRGRHEDAREVQAARTYLRQSLLDLDAAIRKEMDR